jgi:hypothetical protein
VSKRVPPRAERRTVNFRECSLSLTRGGAEINDRKIIMCVCLGITSRRVRVIAEKVLTQAAKKRSARGTGSRSSTRRIFLSHSALAYLMETPNIRLPTCPTTCIKGWVERAGIVHLDTRPRHTHTHLQNHEDLSVRRIGPGAHRHRLCLPLSSHW